MTANRDAEADTDPARRRRWPIILIVGLLLAAAGAVVVVPGLLPASSADPGAEPTATVATAAVERRTVTARQLVDGSLGYVGDFSVIGQASGTLTALPLVGAIVEPGQVLYQVDAKPVILLTGSTPAWRAFDWGTTGVDAQQLNAALVALGYAADLGLDPTSDTVSWRTQRAIKNLQAALGLKKTGALDFGRVVFLPGPIRVTEVPAALGSAAGPGQAVIEATSTTPEVQADIPVSLAQRVKAGDAVTVTLPDQSTTEGLVAAVGTVATESTSGGSATVPVRITLVEPGSAVGLDRAPVSVAITTATVDDALVVPVTAILARPDGGYAVEVVDEAEGAEEEGTRLVQVELGLFDSGGGVVQVTGDGLEAGLRVVVPSA